MFCHFPLNNETDNGVLQNRLPIVCLRHSCSIAWKLRRWNIFLRCPANGKWQIFSEFCINWFFGVSNNWICCIFSWKTIIVKQMTRWPIEPVQPKVHEHEPNNCYHGLHMSQSLQRINWSSSQAWLKHTTTMRKSFKVCRRELTLWIMKCSSIWSEFNRDPTTIARAHHSFE